MTWELSGRVPEEIRERLHREGIQLTPDVERAVLMTLDFVSPTLEAIDSRGSILNPKIMTADDLEELFRNRVQPLEVDGRGTISADQSQKGGVSWKLRALGALGERFGLILAIVAGFAAMFAKLISGFPEFVESIKKIFPWATAHSFISPALAQSGGGNTLASVPLWPIIVYGIYILFAIGYVYSLIKVFSAEKSKDRANAMEIVKGLTAFFIGAISGKAV
jgi:hypothetical protein